MAPTVAFLQCFLSMKSFPFCRLPCWPSVECPAVLAWLDPLLVVHTLSEWSYISEHGDDCGHFILRFTHEPFSKPVNSELCTGMSTCKSEKNDHKQIT